MRNAKWKKTSGFTLVELLVSTAIGMAIMAAIASTFMTQTRYLNAQEQLNEMQQNARAVMDIMVRELKLAGYQPNGGTFDGVTLNTSQLEIKADLDASGAITANSNEDIIYTFDNTNKKILRNGVTLSDNISAFTFAYKKSDGTNASASSEIRQVSLTITAQTAKPDPNHAANNGYRTYQLTSLVTPPNLNY